MELKQLFEKLLELETEKEIIEDKVVQLHADKVGVGTAQEKLVWEHVSLLDCSDHPEGRTHYHYNGSIFKFEGGIGGNIEMTILKSIEVE